MVELSIAKAFPPLLPARFASDARTQKSGLPVSIVHRQQRIDAMYCSSSSPRYLLGKTAVVSILIAVLLPLLPGASLGQPLQRPYEFRRELARKKAERFEKMRSVELAQTQNQTEYDVHYYDLDLTIDPNTQTVSGTVTIEAEVLSASLNQMDLNLLNNMSVNQVRWSGGSLAFSHANDILTITLPTTYYTGETFTVMVDYSGTPSASYGAFGFDTHNGDPMIWSLSEPYGARSWWPCKDIPSDKADSVDVHITVPSNLIVASNGTLVSVIDNGSTKTYNWHEGYPITSYLVSVAIHPYTVFSHWYHYAPAESMEVRYYVYPDHYSSVQSTYALTVPMIELYASLFGEYPFLNEKYGHAEFTWGGGMEHQTITSLGGWGEYLLAHELAHQWWGDMITCNSFHHIWLNEGFATYTEALWSEFTYGKAQYKADMDNAKYFGSGTIFVADTTNFNRIFHSGLSYNKASWVLHMLRHVVGDSTFFDILKAYYSDSRYQYGTITTERFRDICESVSGMDLHYFFHEWIYEEYYPMYKFDWSSTPNGGSYDVYLTIDQLQTNYVFKMPVDITIDFAVGDTTIVVWDSLASQDFALSVEKQPVALHLDKDEWILRTIEEPLTAPTFDRGILLVNGVDFNIYGSSIWSAYADSAFWGSYGISFWDCFPEPASGYPSNLPPPLGHGPVPADTLKQFSSVIWIGNNYNGDISSWYDTPIYSYITVGGNVLLMTRMGQDFIGEPLRQYLGITWREGSYNTLNDCISTYTGLVDMTPIGTQSYCAVFDTSLATGESTLLFKETSSFATHRGLGVWRNPAGGGTNRSVGGQFVFISGRPYRYNHDQMRSNCEYILGNIFLEPYDPTGITDSRPRAAFRLEQNYPNPFNPATTIRFTLPAKDFASLKIYDVSGRLVRTLVERTLEPDNYTLRWDGTNENGRPAASGIYFYRLRAGKNTATKKMVLIR